MPSLWVLPTAADQHRHAATIVPDVLLFKDFTGPGRFNLGRGPFARGLPFGWGHLWPGESSRGDLVPGISHHVEEGIVGLNDLACEIRDQHPDDVRVH